MSMQSKIVAVIDDDPSMLDGLVRLLRAWGFEPAAYDSGEAFWEDHVFSKAICVLVDVNLPGISGIELRRRLGDAKSTLPVIFMTGNSDERTRNAATAAGCVAYLHKPFAAEALFEALKKAAASRCSDRWLSTA
jgi:FixJ family two-component response regulator